MAFACQAKPTYTLSLFTQPNLRHRWLAMARTRTYSLKRNTCKRLNPSDIADTKMSYARPDLVCGIRLACRTCGTVLLFSCRPRAVVGDCFARLCVAARCM